MEVKAQGEGLARPRRDHRLARATRSQDGGSGCERRRFADDAEGVVSERIWMVEFATARASRTPRPCSPRRATRAAGGLSALRRRRPDDGRGGREPRAVLRQPRGIPVVVAAARRSSRPSPGSSAWRCARTTRARPRGTGAAGEPHPGERPRAPRRAARGGQDRRPGAGAARRGRPRDRAALLRWERRPLSDLAAIALVGSVGRNCLTGPSGGGDGRAAPRRRPAERRLPPHLLPGLGSTLLGRRWEPGRGCWPAAVISVGPRGRWPFGHGSAGRSGRGSFRRSDVAGERSDLAPNHGASAAGAR